MQKTDVTIRAIAPGEELPMELLLLADPSPEMIASYIYQARVYVAEKDERLIGVYALTLTEPGRPEIRNLAVAEDFQGQGIGKLLLRHAIERARENGAERLLIGTGNSSVGQLYLYQKMGFEITAIRKNYFVQHYPAPLTENGIPCRHMLMLEMELGTGAAFRTAGGPDISPIT